MGLPVPYLFLPVLFRSPQLSRRAELADWLSRVAESLGLGRCTLHLAVKILDYFMDGHDIQVCTGPIGYIDSKSAGKPKKCHSKPLSPYPLVLSIRRSFGTKNCHCSRMYPS